MNQDHKAEAVRLLEQARRSSRLERVPEEEEPGYDEYHDIEHDIADMLGHLEHARLKLQDIGTDDAELAQLKAHSERLNELYRRRLAEQGKRQGRGCMEW